MSYHPYSKRDPIKNYFPVPNEIYHLGLSAGAIAVYGYLLRIENRETYRSYASYKTIGKAVRMSANTVRKYVMELEERHLIRTEWTMIRTRDGRPRNGTLLYNILPIQEAVNYFHERQMAQSELDTERQRAADRIAQYSHKHPQEPLCAASADEAKPAPPPQKRAN